MFYYSIGPLLDINDLQYVLDTLNKAGFLQWEWELLGSALGLYPSTQKTIEAAHSGDEKRCLRQCLVKWLETADAVDYEGGPRMTSLYAALEDIGEEAAAEYISKLLLLLLF